MDLIEDIRHVSDFRANTAECIEGVTQSRRPLILTPHARRTVVILDVNEYQALVDRLELLEDIGASKADHAEGRTVPHSKAKRELIDRIGQ